MTTFVKRGDTYNVPIMEIYGLSTDEKPLFDTNGMAVPNASIFYEIDKSQVYMFSAETQTWILQ